jgi:hypothetical protein
VTLGEALRACPWSRARRSRAGRTRRRRAARGAPIDTPRNTFDIFDAQGIYLGQVNFPTDSATIYEIGMDYVLGVAKDEFSVEYVVMFELDRRTSE